MKQAFVVPLLQVGWGERCRSRIPSWVAHSDSSEELPEAGILPARLKVKEGLVQPLDVFYANTASWKGGLSDQSWQKDGRLASEHSQGPIG